jgi:hypothetical protein
MMIGVDCDEGGANVGKYLFSMVSPDKIGEDFRLI